MKKKTILIFSLIFLSSIVQATEWELGCWKTNNTDNWSDCFQYTPLVYSTLDNITNNTYSKDDFVLNFEKTFNYTKNLPYRFDGEEKDEPLHEGDGKMGGDYTQTPDETILFGHGDCEDKNILNTVLLRTLFNKTYGELPSNIIYAVFSNGHVMTVANYSDYRIRQNFPYTENQKGIGAYSFFSDNKTDYVLFDATWNDKKLSSLTTENRDWISNGLYRLANEEYWFENPKYTYTYRKTSVSDAINAINSWKKDEINIKAVMQVITEWKNT